MSLTKWERKSPRCTMPLPRLNWASASNSIAPNFQAVFIMPIFKRRVNIKPCSLRSSIERLMPPLFRAREAVQSVRIAGRKEGDPCSRYTRDRPGPCAGERKKSLPFRSAQRTALLKFNEARLIPVGLRVKNFPLQRNEVKQRSQVEPRMRSFRDMGIVRARGVFAFGQHGGTHSTQHQRVDMQFKVDLKSHGFPLPRYKQSPLHLTPS